REMDAPHAPVCRAAARALWALGGNGGPAWLDAAASSDGYTRRLALIALADPRLPIDETMQANAKRLMVAALHSDDSLIAVPAAEGLCRFWPESASELLSRAEKIDAVRAVLVDHLVRDQNAMIGRPKASDILSGERSTGDVADDATLTRLGRIVAPVLVTELTSPLREVSDSAEKCMLRLARTPLAPAIAAAIKSAVRDSDNHDLARIVGHLIGPGNLATPALIECAHSTDPAVRATVITALADRSESFTNADALAVMTAAVSDSSIPVQTAALKWANRVDNPSAELIRQLSDVAGNVRPQSGWHAEARILAINSIGRFGAEPNIAVPALREAVKMGDKDVSLAAIVALRSFGLGAEAATEELLELVDSNDPNVRAAAAETLIHLGAKARHAVAPHYAALLGATMQQNGNVIPIVHKIAELGPDAQPAMGNLVRLLASQDNDLRIEVAQALGDLGTNATPAMPSLIRMVDNKNAKVRAAAVAALTRIAPDGSGLGPALMAAVYNADRSSADRFAIALRRSGDVQTLSRRLSNIGQEDPDADVRKVAQRAVQYFQANPASSTTQPAA
ncbi:MAG TPA: HEAT repeat domain-containing protein, partial [Tepidisphaeraceae bacterium]|nr:HEAT repeat domain-containing protein [Tepidisphaeraceae bacterium]